MQTAMGRFTHLDMTNRQNWKVCWRWSISILAMEMALAVALIAFAVGSRANTPSKPELTQSRQAQQQSSVVSRKTCPLADLRKTQAL